MTPTSVAKYWKKKDVVGLLSRVVPRTLQCTFAILVAVLYGLDLRQATNNNVKADSAWVYAEFVAGVSIVVSAAHLIFTTAVWYGSLLDGLIFVLWVAQFWVFAITYLKTGEKLDDNEFAAVVSYSRMRSAVWVNLVSMLLWLAAIIQGFIGCFTRRKNRRQKEMALELVSVNDLSSTHNAVAVQASGDMKGLC